LNLESNGLIALDHVPVDKPPLTLRAHDDERYLSDGPVDTQLVVVPVHLLEAGLVLQAEHQDHGVHPARKLKATEVRNRNGGALSDMSAMRRSARQRPDRRIGTHLIYGSPEHLVVPFPLGSPADDSVRPPASP